MAHSNVVQFRRNGNTSLRYLRQMTVLQQWTDVNLQLQIISLLGQHQRLTVLQVAQHLFPNRSHDELPLATVELAIGDLRKTGMVRRHWLPGTKRFCLVRYGRQLYQEIFETNCASQPVHRRSRSEGLLP